MAIITLTALEASTVENNPSWQNCMNAKRELDMLYAQLIKAQSKLNASGAECKTLISQVLAARNPSVVIAPNQVIKYGPDKGTFTVTTNT